MLTIHVGRTESTVVAIDRLFHNVFEDYWIVDPLVKEIIRDVDKSEVVSERIIDSPVFSNPITPRELSGGTKALILMLFQPERELWGTACGDNCAKWILKIAEKHDLTLSFGHIMKFPEPFSIAIKNSGKIVNTMKSLVVEMHNLLRYSDGEV